MTLDQASSGQETYTTPQPSSVQGDAEAQGQAGLSSIQKLKQRYRDTVDLLETERQRNESFQDELRQLREEVQSVRTQSRPKGPEDYSSEELLQVALSPDTEDITARRAIATAFQKRIGELEKKLESSLESAVEKRLRADKRTQTASSELGLLARQLGPEKFQPGEALHDAAQSHFVKMLRQVDDDISRVPPAVRDAFKVTAFKLAANDLGLLNRAKETREVPESLMAPGGGGPSQQETYEAEKKRLLDAGDTKGVAALAMKRYYAAQGRQ